MPRLVPKRKRVAISIISKESFETHVAKTHEEKGMPALSPRLFFNLPGLRKVNKGFLLDSSRLASDIHSALEMLDGVYLGKGAANRMNLERLILMRQLKGLGLDVLTPKYSFVDPHFLNASRKYARPFKADPQYAGSIGQKKLADSSVSWTRDSWIKIRGKRMMRFPRMGYGVNFDNKLGEGGMVVALSENSFLVSDKLRSNPVVENLSSKGVQFYFLKDGHKKMMGLSRIYEKNIYELHDHVDLFAGVAGKVMLVDPSYYEINGGILKMAAKANGLKLLFVPPAEVDLHPANFIVIGENKVLMDRAAKGTIALLRANGIEVIPTAVSLKENRKSGGGVRCMVNEL